MHPNFKILLISLVASACAVIIALAPKPAQAEEVPNCTALAYDITSAYVAKHSYGLDLTRTNKPTPYTLKVLDFANRLAPNGSYERLFELVKLTCEKDQA